MGRDLRLVTCDLCHALTSMPTPTCPLEQWPSLAIKSYSPGASQALKYIIFAQNVFCSVSLLGTEMGFGKMEGWCVGVLFGAVFIGVIRLKALQ